MSKYRITLEGKTYEMEIELVSGNTAPQPAAKPEVKPAVSTAAAPAAPSAPTQAAPAGGAGAVIAPMPGTVLRLEKASGDAVKAGEVVLVLEAMKMENEILAPKDGTIANLNCAAGSTVPGGAVLFEVV